jgi:hypothetical protein
VEVALHSHGAGEVMGHHLSQPLGPSAATARIT